MSSGTMPSSVRFPATGRAPTGKPVAALISEESLSAYGYLLLPIAVMQTVGSAAQTVAGIRSHWGRKTFADERTIAVAACLDESTIRRRHLPKLFKSQYMCHRMVPSRLGHRREWFFTTEMQAAGYWTKKSVTLPRWAALMLPEWSYRAIYAAVLQRSLATARGSQKGPVPLDAEAVLWGGYGRHNFSLSHLAKITGVSRRAVVAAKLYLLRENWLTLQFNPGHGDELFLNSEKMIPPDILQESHRTTRRVMFGGLKGVANAG